MTDLRTRGRLALLVALIAVAAATLLATGVGAVRIDPGESARIIGSRLPFVRAWIVPDWDPTHEAILWDVRLPRVLMGVLVGAALATAGSAFQGMLKNPMADPYVVGVSAGASLGAVVALTAQPALGALTSLGVPLFAFVGALITLLFVYRLASVGGRLPVLGVLLAGIVVGGMALSLVSVIILLNPDRSHQIVFWLMGGLGSSSWSRIALAAPYFLIGYAGIAYYARHLNALLLGEESAFNIGVDVEQVKRRIFLFGSLLTASAVSFSGAIGFVGLIVPHLTRFWTGPDHRLLLPVSALLGGTVLVLADMVGRSLAPTGEFPVGVVMAIAGGPFFLYLLRRRVGGPWR